MSSKHLIQVHMEILSRSVENMASHLLTKFITRSKSRECLSSLESWNCCTCTSCAWLPSCTWLPFLIGQVCSQVRCRPYFGANFGFFALRTFSRSSYILPLHTQSRFQVHLHYTWRLWCEASKYLL